MEYTTTNYESLSSKLNVVCNSVLILLADELLIVPFLRTFQYVIVLFYSKIYVICLPEICITRLICISLYNNILTPLLITYEK